MAELQEELPQPGAGGVPAQESITPLPAVNEPVPVANTNEVTSPQGEVAQVEPTVDVPENLKYQPMGVGDLAANLPIVQSPVPVQEVAPAPVQQQINAGPKLMDAAGDLVDSIVAEVGNTGEGHFEDLAAQAAGFQQQQG